MNNYLKSSPNPLDDINAIAYDGQPLENRLYKQGFEEYFNLLPELKDEDPFLDIKLGHSKAILGALADELKGNAWTKSMQPLPGKFNRTILAIEEPSYEIKNTGAGFRLGNTKEGKEIVLARWGDGMTSPVHGHADGLLYEQLIFGKMRVNTYRITDHANRIARPVETTIYSGFQSIAQSYTLQQRYNRSALVHNFTSLGYSASLHFVPEHTRDGRDNGFGVEYFDREHQFAPSSSFTQLTAQQGIEQLRLGDVALVRSENVPDYGDHFIVITGKSVLKEHGLRPQEVAIHAPYAARILNHYEPVMGLTLLKLSPVLTKQFHAFHDIVVKGDSVKFPKP